MRETLLGVGRLAHRVALHLEVDANDLAHLVVVVDDEHHRAARRLSRAGTLEECVEVAAPVAAVPTGRVEGRNAAEIGPLADRALRDPEVLCGLSESQPVRLAAAATTRAARIAVCHRPANLPKCVLFFTPHREGLAERRSSSGRAARSEQRGPTAQLRFAKAS